jgi:hyperpolarization activated cyclic nucleotide-gated potassium channel 4
MLSIRSLFCYHFVFSVQFMMWLCLACFSLFFFIQWTLNQASGRKEELRYLLWIRLARALKVTEFFTDLEKDIRVNYLFTRIVKLIVVELYCTHTAACIFYYLATTLPESMEGHTWIGSLQLGDYSYSNFREIDITKRYITSLYFAIVTMATVGNFWSHVSAYNFPSSKYFRNLVCV